MSKLEFNNNAIVTMTTCSIISYIWSHEDIILITASRPHVWSYALYIYNYINMVGIYVLPMYIIQISEIIDNQTNCLKQSNNYYYGRWYISVKLYIVRKLQ